MKRNFKMKWKITSVLDIKKNYSVGRIHSTFLEGPWQTNEKLQNFQHQPKVNASVF